MYSRKNTVLLLKAPSAEPEDPYQTLLSRKNFQVDFVPVLSFEFVNAGDLRSALQNPDEYCSCVMTSQRAVEAVQRVVCDDTLQGCDSGWNSPLVTPWQTKVTYVVGSATLKAAEELGLQTRGACCGNSDNLSNFIIEDSVSSNNRLLKKPSLFLCGNLKMETMPKKLEEKGIHLNCLTVYRTTSDSNIKANLQSHFDTKGSPEYIVFYSPSGVTYALGSILEIRLAAPDTKYVAIGPTTRDALVKAGVEVHAMAEKPTPEHLCQVIAQSLNTSENH